MFWIIGTFNIVQYHFSGFDCLLCLDCDRGRAEVCDMPKDPVAFFSSVPDGEYANNLFLCSLYHFLTQDHAYS